MNKNYYRTLGYLAKKARFEAMVPHNSKDAFETRYRKVTSEAPKPGKDGYYLHPNPNVNKWAPELRLTFEATDDILSSLDFGANVKPVRGGRRNEYRINSNDYIWQLWTIGFRNGDRQNVELIRPRLPQEFQRDFDEGYGLIPRTPEELDNEGREYNETLEQQGGLEGKEHRQLKEFVANNPPLLGLYAEKGVQEFQFVSGDKCDVVIDLHQLGMAVVEVKHGMRGELVKGVYQAIKYRVLMEAERGHGTPFPVKAFLVAYEIPGDIRQFAEGFSIICKTFRRDQVVRWHESLSAGEDGRDDE